MDFQIHHGVGWGDRGGAPPPPPPGAGAGAGTMLGTFTLIQVFKTSTRDPLPVPIESNLPAIELPFGNENDKVVPNVWACTDVGAGATWGDSLFFRPLWHASLTLSNVLLWHLILSIPPLLFLVL